MLKPRFLLVVGIALLLSFQNCSNPDFAANSGSQEKSSELDSGGQPYDGKVFVVRGQCPDQTYVSSRIVLNNSTRATLFRENCVTIVPRELAASEFSYDEKTPNSLLHNQQTYTSEAPVLAPLASGYYQWNNSFRSITPSVYFIDGIGYGAADIQQLKSEGHRVVCVITAGVTSNRDSDRGSFSAADVGKPVPGTDESWLDTRSANVRSVMLQRLERVRAKGCDGVTWDQTDAHTNDSGFPLTFDTGADYARYLAFAVKDRDLIVALSNTGELAAQLAPVFDMQYGQNCYHKGFCDRYKPFVDLGKPVFIADDSAYSQARCDSAKASRFSLWFTSPTQDGSRYEPCK